MFVFQTAIKYVLFIQTTLERACEGEKNLDNNWSIQIYVWTSQCILTL